MQCLGTKTNAFILRFGSQRRIPCPVCVQFRILMTQPNTGGSWALALAGFEVYGKLKKVVSLRIPLSKIACCPFCVVLPRSSQSCFSFGPTVLIESLLRLLC
jgi:hypothetical protein